MRPFGQRNFLNTLRAMFKWAVEEGRVPSDPTLGVTRQKLKSIGYLTWSEEQIAQYQRKHPIGTMARLAIELMLATAARRGDAAKLGPHHVEDGTITFEHHKKDGDEAALVLYRKSTRRQCSENKQTVEVRHVHIYPGAQGMVGIVNKGE
jgi:integrase